MALLEGAPIWAGIDIGSTTTKLVVYDPTAQKILYSQYKRHHAAQKKSVLEALKLLDGRFPNKNFKIAMTGSGSKPISKILGLPFVQEVVANSIALKKIIPT